jgi:hypothetical protein
MDSVERTIAEVRAKAVELRESFGDDARARAIEWAATQFERAVENRADEQLTLAQASARSGYSQDHLARLIREGRLPNAGRHGSPRIRAGDLPVRPDSRHQNTEIVVSDPSRVYDPVADARAIGNRR